MTYIPAGYSEIVIRADVAARMVPLGLLNKEPPVRSDGTCTVVVTTAQRKALDAFVVKERIDYTEAFIRLRPELAT